MTKLIAAILRMRIINDFEDADWEVVDCIFLAQKSCQYWLLWTLEWTFGSHVVREISWVPEDLLVSPEQYKSWSFDCDKIERDLLTSSIFWVVTQRKAVRYRRFGTTCLPFLRVKLSKKIAWSLKIGPTGSPETSVSNSLALCNNSEEGRLYIDTAEV